MEIITKGPFEIISCHIFSFGKKLEKFWKFTVLVPRVSEIVRFGPWEIFLDGKVNKSL
jgi:hypothetical protein